MSLLLDYLPLAGPDEYQSGDLTILGISTVTVDTSFISPYINVLVPKRADIKSYIIRRHNEVTVNTGSAHIEIETRHPDIKVIDIE